MSKGLLPTIMGMNPPTKEILMFKNIKMGGYDLLIYHAEFPEGTKQGTYKSNDFSELKGMANWLHFTDAEAMERFGNDIVKFAKRNKRKVDKCQK